MNITVQTIGVDTSSINGKSEIPNKTLANITRDILLNQSSKKKLCCRRAIVILASVLLGISLLPLIEDAYPPVV